MPLFSEKARSFLGGRPYVILVMLLIFLGNTTGADVPCAALLLFAVLLGFCVCDDLRFLVPPLCGFVCIVPLSHTPYAPTESDFYSTGAMPWVIGASLLLLGCGIAVFALRHRERIKKPDFSKSAILTGLCAFGAGLVLNGLFHPENGSKNLIFGMGIAASFVCIFLPFRFFHPADRENAEHFLFSMAALGICVLAELIVLYLTHVAFKGGVPVKQTVMIGWGTWTHIGALLTVCLPCAFYFARSCQRGWVGLLAACAIFIGIFMTVSRGAWLYGGFLFVLCLILLCIGGENKKQNRAFAFSLLTVCTALLLIFRKGLVDFLLSFMQVGFTDNGRFALWKSALLAFRSFPLFGVGFLGSGIALEGWPALFPFMYHNTLLQMLGACGLFGAFAYLFHRAQTLFLAFRARHSPLAVFLLLSAAALMLASLTDEHIFHIYPAFWYVIALHLAEGCYKKES